MPAVGLTDHGSLAGTIDLFKAAKKEGVKPVIGCEVYVADDRKAQQKGYAHLTLLAETTEGYGNLIKLSSLGYLEGYYYKPRVDWELLERHADGLVALSGCLSGRVCKALEEGRATDAEGELDRLTTIFGRDDVYVEMQNAHLDVQQRINPVLAQLAERRGLPIVATGDVHYLRHEDARAHEALLCIQSGDSLKNPNHWKFDTDHFYFKTAGGDGRRLPRARGRAAAHARGGRALQRRDRARPDPAAALPGARRPRRVRLSRRALREGARAALRHGHAGSPGAAEVRAEDDQGDGLRRLLPDRRRLHRLREAQRGQRRPRPRLRRRQPRRVLPRHHRPRPDPLRPAVRAVPQPGPQGAAGHRHRLRRRRSRARDQLRRREVRPRPRRADHHVRDDGRARRGSRRRPRARGAVRRRRQGGEADPGRARPDARGLPQGGQRAPPVVRLRPADTRDRRPRPAARGADPAGLDPRRRRRHRRRAADEHRAAAAEGAGPGSRDAVLDEQRRRGRAAEGGLPRPAQPRRDRQGVRADRRPRHRRRSRSTTRRRTRCSRAARRPASSSSSRRACARRCGRSSRPSSRT